MPGGEFGDKDLSPLSPRWDTWESVFHTVTELPGQDSRVHSVQQLVKHFSRVRKLGFLPFALARQSVLGFPPTSTIYPPLLVSGAALQTCDTP